MLNYLWIQGSYITFLSLFPETIISVLLILLVMGPSCFEQCRSLTDASLEREKTLAMIKPDGLLSNYTDEIKRVILESGFNIFKEKIIQLNEEQTATFYAEHSSKSFFTSLIKYMTRYHLLWCRLMSNFSCWTKIFGLQCWKCLICWINAMMALIFLAYWSNVATWIQPGICNLIFVQKLTQAFCFIF